MENTSLRAAVLTAISLTGLFCSGTGPADETSVTSNQRRYWCVFLDAVGQPIPCPNVQIFSINNEGEKVLLCETSADDQGGLKDPNLHINPDRCFFVVSHPDYGTALANRAPYEGLDSSPYCYVPFVARDGKEYACSLRGVILDSDSRPIPGARITCRAVSAPGSVWISGLAGAYTVLSDSVGQFTTYIPLQNTTGTFQIPAHSVYSVIVQPASRGLGIWSGQISNDQPCSIVLEKANHFRTFAFEEANGPITDLERLKAVSMEVDVPHYGRWSISYPGFKDGLVLPLGEVSAAIYGVKGYPRGLCEFEPLTITDDSPQQLVFKAKSKSPVTGIVYTGRVVHGITGKPMAGVFVAAADSTSESLSPLAPDQWENLHKLPEKPSLDDPQLKPLLLIYSSRAVTRTNAKGLFEMTVSTLSGFEFITALERDYVALPHYAEVNPAFTPDQNNVVRLPDIKLYPAATVLIEPVVGGVEVRIRPKWQFPDANTLGPFEGPAEDYRWERLMVNNFLRTNRANRLCIPADVNVQLQVDVVRSLTWDDRRWVPMVTSTVRARQGEVVNLGRMVFEQLMYIYVQVVDSAGRPVKGVGVTHEKDPPRPYRLYDQIFITGEEGIAQFQVPAHRKGNFFVGCHHPGKGYVTESASYSVAGPQDANKIFTLRLSDEMLKKLFQ